MSRYQQENVTIGNRGINGSANLAASAWTAQEISDENDALSDTSLGIVAKVIFATSTGSKDYVKVKFLKNGKLLGTFKSRDYVTNDGITFRNSLLADYDIWSTNGFDSLASLDSSIDDNTLSAPSGTGQLTVTATLDDDDDTTVDVTTTAEHRSDNPTVASVTSAGVVTGLVAGVKASVTLTGTANPADAETVAIGGKTYRFKNTTAQANDVKIGAALTDTLDNLKAAVNASGTGDGTDYHTGTTANANVDAGTKTATTLLFTAEAVGTAGNSVTSTETSSVLSFSAATLYGGLPATATITSRYQGEEDTVSVTVS